MPGTTALEERTFRNQVAPTRIHVTQLLYRDGSTPHRLWRSRSEAKLNRENERTTHYGLLGRAVLSALPVTLKNIFRLRCEYNTRNRQRRFSEPKINIVDHDC